MHAGMTEAGVFLTGYSIQTVYSGRLAFTCSYRVATGVPYRHAWSVTYHALCIQGSSLNLSACTDCTVPFKYVKLCGM